MSNKCRQLSCFDAVTLITASIELIVLNLKTSKSSQVSLPKAPLMLLLYHYVVINQRDYKP